MDEVEIVDAPADIVVDKLLDMLAEMGAYDAVDRLERGEADGSTDVEDE